MWELRNKSARGRLSWRRFSLVAMAMVMAMFALATTIAPRALAADAVREGDTLVYDGRTLTPMTDAQRPSGVQKDVTGYALLDKDTSKAYFILTTGDATKATTGQYVIYDFTPPDHFSNSSPPVTVSIVTGSSANGSDENKSGTNSCNGQILQGIGWILCPVVNFLASGMDHLFDALTGFLVVQPARASDDNSLFRMWGIVRNIANISFVIVFLFVIYSQVTSVGISNYGIKKIMPRLIIAAILVNISFWVCALAIDITNTLGYSIHSLFMGVFDSLNSADAYQNLTWSNIATTLLSGTAVSALAVYGIYSVASAGVVGSLIMFIPTLVGVLLSILVALLVISVRQALITCLVIISPLAFVAFLLPNTEKYFTKWRELFVTLLLVYPIFAVVFGGAQLAGLAIIQNAGGSLNLIILGMAVQIAPIVVTPLLIKVSGSLVGKIAALANNPRQNIMKKTSGWAEGRAAEAKARALASGRANRLTQAIDSQRRWREGNRKLWEEAADHRFEASARGESLEAFRQRNANTKKRIDNAFAASAVGQTLRLESMGLDVDKQDIESTMMDSNDGRTLRQRQVNAESRKTEVENAFNRDARGQQARARRERASIDTTRVENEFSQTTAGQDIDRARRVVDSQKKLIEGEHSERFALSAEGKEFDLQIRRHDSREAARKATSDRHYSELVAGTATDGYYGNFATDTALQAEGTTLTSELAENQLVIDLDTKAKRNADLQLQKNIAHQIESTEAHTRLGGLSAREYAAGIGGTQGQASALANAQSTLREQLGKFSAEYEDLRNEYMPPVGEIKDFLEGRSSTLEFKKGDDVVLTVDDNNTAALNAMAKHITTIGIVDEVTNMLKLSGKGQRLYDYRETIADALARRGVAQRSIYEGGQMIELVRQGQIASETDVIEYIQTQIDGGKVSADDLSKMDAKALRRFATAIKHERRVGKENDAGVEVASLSKDYDKKVARLLKNAHLALTDERLNAVVKDAAGVELKKFQDAYAHLPHTKDADGKDIVDVEHVSLNQIRRAFRSGHHS